MENLNGSLGFKATLDIDDFRVSADAMERHIKRVSDTAVSESAMMEQSIQNFAVNGAKYITSFLVGAGMKSLLESIVQTRGQFQQLEIAFTTMLGSGSKAQTLMNQMVETAAKTPFDLMGVAGGAKQLLAYGESADKVNDTLVRLGNIASGLSIPLNDIVYLYGTTMVQGRLYAQDVRQFTGRGIPLVKELAKEYGVTADEINRMVSEGKIGFPQVEKVIKKLTDSGGQFYNLMEKQSKSLTGMISNLGDAWDGVKNEIGKENQDLFAGVISGATTVVEHFDEILRIVKAITIAYGSYKAAIVLQTLVTKGYTGVALIDNTVRQAKIQLMKLDATLTGQTAAQTQRMTAAETANTAALQKQLTVEELSNLQKKLRIATIASLLTAQQQEYMSNLGLTMSSRGYEAAAMGVLTVDQRVALQKTDLSATSAAYRAALIQEVAAKTQNQAATLATMRADVKAAAAKMEVAKQTAITSMQTTEAARTELYYANMSLDSGKILSAQKKLEAAQENQAIARKAALAAQSDFYTKKKLLEATATRQSTVASAADTAAKNAQTTATNLLSAATRKASLAIKSLWTSMKSNPIGWIVTAIGLVVSALSLFGKKEEETTDMMGEFQDTTKKQVDELNLLFTILSSTERGTKTHRDTVEKINKICKEYNKTLLEENATLDKQKEKYNELTVAVQSATAEKIKAKYVEQALKDAIDEQTESLGDLKDYGKNAGYQHKTGRMVTDKYGTTYEETIYKEAEHIQGMGDQVYDMVESMAQEKAAKLSKMTGETFTQELDKLVAEVSAKIKDVSSAGDEEMKPFMVHLKKYFTEYIESARKADKEIQKVTDSMDAFYETKDASGVIESVNYVDKSFEELEAEAKQVQAEIDWINQQKVNPEVYLGDLWEMLDLLDKINDAIDQKTTDLNTEAGINARVKQLKEERANVEINSARYNELTREINKLQNKIPKHRTGGGGGGVNDVARARKAYAKEELEAARELEEARVSVMEEGYDKRKAVLELEHQERLSKINEEEKHLAELSRKAGRGGLSQDVKKGFSERRDLENQSYEKDKRDLFNEEISYRKEQYALYYRWVESMGKDVADKQFSTLLKSAGSYKEWIEQEIARLESKKTSGDWDSGDEQNLFSLHVQDNEINGRKSAMDQFRETVQQTIRQTTTLAAKLQAVVELKEKLRNGDFNLNPDQKLEAENELDNVDKDTQKELNQRVLNDYKSFEEKRSEIQADYAAMRLTDLAQSNKDIMDKINEGEKDALSSLEAMKLQSSVEWKELFTSLDVLSASEIQKLIKKIESEMDKSKLKLSPADFESLINSLNKAKEKVVSLNPFKALGNAFDKYIKATKKLRDAENKNLTPEQIKKLKKEVKESSKTMVDSIAQINQVIASVGSSLSSLASSFGNSGLADTISGVTDVLGGAGETAMGVGKIMSGDLLGGITGVVSGVSSVIGAFNKMHDKKNEKRIKRLQEQIDQLTISYEDLGDAIERAYSTDKASLLEEQNKNLEAQNARIRKQIEEEKSKKDTNWDRIKDWEDKIRENEKQIAENRKYTIIEAIMGTDVMSAIDQFADAYADAWARGEKAAGKSFETVKNLIKTAIIEQLKNKLKPEVEAFMTAMAEAMKDGLIDDAEEKMLDEYQQRLEDTADKYLEQNKKWLQDDDAINDPLKGAVRSMSEETGGVIAGRLNAAIINQSEQAKILRDNLMYNAQIANNTAVSASELKEIKTTLKRMENGHSLLSQGIE